MSKNEILAKIPLKEAAELWELVKFMEGIQLLEKEEVEEQMRKTYRNKGYKFLLPRDEDEAREVSSNFTKYKIKELLERILEWSEFEPPPNNPYIIRSVQFNIWGIGHLLGVHEATLYDIAKHYGIALEVQG